MTSVRAVLFDAVGTLIYPDPPVADAYQALGRRFGSARTRDEIAPRFRQAFRRQEDLDAQGGEATSEAGEVERWRNIVAEVFDDLADTQALFEALWEHFAHARHWRLFDDVAEAWGKLSERGFPLGIASNFDQRLDALCAGLPPLADCRQRFVSSRLGCRKPCPRFFRAIEAALGLRPEEILLIGDDFDNDFQGARAAGWQALLLSRESPRDQAPSHQQISSLEELEVP